MRSAAARAARRRGESSHTAPLHHGWPRMAGATRVVLPAPGGATTTALGRSVSAATMSGRTASIESGGRCAAIAASIGAGDREGDGFGQRRLRSEEHTSELQSLMRISYAVFCLKKKNRTYA